MKTKTVKHFKIPSSKDKNKKDEIDKEKVVFIFGETLKTARNLNKLFYESKLKKMFLKQFKSELSNVRMKKNDPNRSVIYCYEFCKTSDISKLDFIDIIWKNGQQIGTCPNCICEFLEISNSYVRLNNKRHTVKKEVVNKKQKCSKCNKNFTTLYKFVDSKNNESALICSTCMADFIESNKCLITLNKKHVKII